ncbi:MAG: hypothetical protein U5K31_02825 [Balneolaceae bacterium]|nr:hypothetical protein [Balneolaceae bacterium]
MTKPAGKRCSARRLSRQDMERLRGKVDSLNRDAPEKAREQVEQLQQGAGRPHGLPGRAGAGEPGADARMQADSTPRTAPGLPLPTAGAGRRPAASRMAAGRSRPDSSREASSPPAKASSKFSSSNSRSARACSRRPTPCAAHGSRSASRAGGSTCPAWQYILFSLIDLSLNQEEVARETDRLANRSQAFVEQARTQRSIRQHFIQLSDSLFSLSTQIPGFSNAINKKKLEVERQLENAVTYLAERNKSNASFALRESLGGINDLASSLAQLLDQISNSQSQSASMSMQQFMQQMQNMSQNQQQLNDQLQQMINDMAGDRLSQDQMERLNQLARQQRQIREQLQQLQQSGVLEPGDEVLSEMERMSEQMEQSINDMRGGQTDANVAQRQQNILSRMLSAQQAVQERGEKEEREASTAKDAPRATPPDVTLEELQNRIRSLLNDPQRTRFKQDYQQLIQRYFELLKEIEDN